MWTPRITPGKNLAQNIVRALESDIECGALKPGDRLPTQRELADSLKLALGTVTRAYSLAKDHGLVTGTVGRGTFVAGEREDGGEPIDFSRNLVHRDQRDAGVRALLAALGEPARLAQLLDREQDPAGVAEHRAVAAGWISRGAFRPSWDHIVVCSGVQHGMHVVLATTTRPGDIVVTEAVTYAGIKAIAALLGLDLRGVPVDAEGLDPRAFEHVCRKGAKVLYTTPTLHNPTAAIMSDGRRREIARIAEQHGVTIIEDDVYAFLAPDAPLPIAAYAPANTYYMVGTSKCLAAGIRVAYAVCPPGAAQRIANTVRTTVWETSPMMSALVTRWIEDGTAARIIASKAAEVRARHQIASSTLSGLQAPAVTTPHWWIRLPDPWHADDLTNECRQRGLIVAPASAFAIDRGNVPAAVRICLAAVSTRQRLQQGLDIFRDVLERGPNTYFSTT